MGLKGPAAGTVARASRWLARRWVARPLPLAPGQAVVSFSFDDAPHSACEQGRRVLEDLGCQGTWYIAGGLTDRDEQGKRCHSVADVRDLLKAGHHVGCHTFSHAPCDQLSTAQVRAEFDRNAEFLAAAGVPLDGLDFAFPLGAFDWGSKRVAMQRFRSARVTGGGVNRGVADTHALKAERLYSGTTDTATVRAQLHELAALGGWQIFYTHGVEAQPNAWGCTPELLRGAVSDALAAGCRVLSVRDALTRWQSQAKTSS